MMASTSSADLRYSYQLKAHDARGTRYESGGDARFACSSYASVVPCNMQNNIIILHMRHPIGGDAEGNH